MNMTGAGGVTKRRGAGEGGGEREAKRLLRDHPAAGLHGEQEDPSVLRGWAALLEAAAGTNAGRSRQFAALLELERRSKLIKGLQLANEVLQVRVSSARTPANEWLARSSA